MTEKTKLVVGIGWYEPDQWELLKNCAADSDALDHTYEEWKSGVNRAIQELHENGVFPKKVSVRVPELIEWCKDKGYKLDGEARSEYVSYLISKRA